MHFFLDFRKEMVGIGNYCLSVSFEEKINIFKTDEVKESSEK
jgi:hypothetical protein